MNNIKRIAILFCLMFCCASVVWAQDVQRLVLWDQSMQHKQALEVILDETVHDHGPYEIISSIPMNDGRALAELQAGDGLDILSAPATIERHNLLLPLNLPTHSNFLGCRIMYVRQGEEDLLKDIKTIQDIWASGIRFGSGQHWADTPILGANGLDVVTTAVSTQLVPMLQGHRFDVYPRGLGEVLHDLRERLAAGEWQDIAVDSHIVLEYPFRDIFYLGRKAYELRARLHTGFQRAVESGGWAKFHAQRVQELLVDLRELKLTERTVIQLENPFMPDIVKAIPIEFNPLDPEDYPQYTHQ